MKEMRTPTLLDCCRKVRSKTVAVGCNFIAIDGQKYRVKQVKGNIVKACLEDYDNPLYTFEMEKVEIL